MRVFILALVAGVWLLQQQAGLPPSGQVAALAALALLVALAAGFAKNSALARRRVLVRCGWRLLGGLAALALGFAWAGWRAELRLAQALESADEGRDIVVSGVVAGLPQAMERGTRFVFDIEEAPAALPRRVSLAWYHTLGEEPDMRLAAEAVRPPAPLRAGERWRFTVRLKRPHGASNPGGFDYEAWLLERGVRATGYVRSRAQEKPQRLSTAVWTPALAVEMARESLRDRYRARLAEAPLAGILVALAIGDQQAIPADLWQLFARTGITHLFSVSGLHVTLFAALAQLSIAWLWRRSARLPLYWPAPQAAALGGFAAALLYSLLAGFSVPTQRTLYMLGVACLALLSRREIAASRVLAAALALVVMLDPWAVLAPGFWLSFVAVGLLFYVSRGEGASRGGWLAEWWRGQWAIGLGLLPLLLALFQQFSLISPLTNAIAIPLVSALITPLTLAGALPGLSFLLSLAHQLALALVALMEVLGRPAWTVWQQAAAPWWLSALGLAGAWWLLLPRGVPARWLGLLGLLPLLSYAPPRPPSGEARALVLDVGQGLAVHVQTAGHDLLFDTGPAFSAEADSGNRTIVPYLRWAGVRRLDRLIVSHRDKDHEGGAASVLAALPVAELMGSLPFEHALSMQPVPYRPCVAGEEWEWDGVRFAVLHPSKGWWSEKGNVVSCVLRVSAGGRSLLIASDIEADEETRLLVAQNSALARRRQSDLAADVLVVPHHGSRSSSTPEFVAAVGARAAIFTVGYRNRFGHPAAEVLERYVASGAEILRSDRDGAIHLRLAQDGVGLERQRERVRRYWMP